MDYTILHELPGRLRVHCCDLWFSPDSRLELKRWVSRHRELVSASFSTITGNMLIIYSRGAARESILLLLEELRLFDGANIGAGRDARDDVLTRAVAGTCLKEGTRLVAKRLLPPPAQYMLAAGKGVARLLRLLGALLDGDFAAFWRLAGRCILFAVASSSLPLRFLLGVGVSLLEQSPPDFVALGYDETLTGDDGSVLVDAEAVVVHEAG